SALSTGRTRWKQGVEQETPKAPWEAGLTKPLHLTGAALLAARDIPPLQRSRQMSFGVKPRVVRIMTWARTLCYAHCAVTIACVGSVAYGFSRYDMAWQFRLYVEWLLSHPGGWSAYHVLKLSCLAFPLGVMYMAPARFPAWRRIAIIVAE